MHGDGGKIARRHLQPCFFARRTIHAAADFDIRPDFPARSLAVRRPPKRTRCARHNLIFQSTQKG